MTQLVGYRYTGVTISELFSGGLETQQPMDVYVNSVTGSDTVDSGGAAETPYKTIRYALSRLPKRIRHLVTVNVAQGTYDGFVVQGFHFDPLTDGTGCGLFLKGVLVDATNLTSGTAVGTVSSTVTGSITTGTFTVINDLTQNWTPSELKGKFLVVTAGAALGTILVIADNTSTSISVTTGVAVGATSYAIRDPGPVITGAPILVPGSVPSLTAASPAPSKAWIAVYDNVVSSRSTSIRLEGFRIAPIGSIAADTGILINIHTSIVGLGRMSIAPMSGGSCIALFGTGTVSLTSMAMTAGTNSNAITAGGVSTAVAPTITTNGILIMNGGSGSAGMSLGSSHGQGVSLLNSQIESIFGINIVGMCQLQFSGICRIPGTGSSFSQAVRSRILSLSVGGTTICLLSGAALNITGRTATTAIEAGGSHHYVFDGNLIIDQCAVGIGATQCAKVRISAGSTITNASVAELQLDNTANFALSAMRAASPRLVNNAYGSVIYE